MTTIVQLIELLTMALKLYKKAGYEITKQRLLDEIEKHDDATTISELNNILK